MLDLLAGAFFGLFAGAFFVFTAPVVARKFDKDDARSTVITFVPAYVVGASVANAFFFNPRMVDWLTSMGFPQALALVLALPVPLIAGFAAHRATLLIPAAKAQQLRMRRLAGPSSGQGSDR